LRDPIRQRRAFDQFQDQCVDAICDFQPVNDRNVGMVECRQEFGFALEPGEPVRILREHLQQDLDRDVAIQLRVVRAIHLAHPARADLRGDFIGAEAGTGGKGHGGRRGLYERGVANENGTGPDASPYTDAHTVQ
jgi:hypothetical protein